MSLLVLLAIVMKAASPSILWRLTTRAISPLTVSGVVITMAVVEIEHVTGYCDHQRHLHGVIVTAIMGLAWCVQLLLALMNPTGWDVGHVAEQSSFRATPPASPITNWRRKRWGGKRMYADRLLGRSGRFRQARRMYIRIDRSPNQQRHGRTLSRPLNATHARRNASRVRVRRRRVISIISSNGHTPTRHTVLAIGVYAAGLAHARALQLAGHIPHPVGRIQDVRLWLSRPSHAVSSVAKQPLWIPLARITCATPRPDSRMSCPMTRKCFSVRSHVWRSPKEHTQPCQTYSASLTCRLLPYGLSGNSLTSAGLRQ